MTDRSTINSGPHKGLRRIFKWVAAGVLAIALAAGGAVLYAYQQLAPVKMDWAKEVQVTIHPGSSVREIGQLLEDKGLIRNGAIFAYYARFQGLAGQLKAGEYVLKSGQSVPQILQQLAAGEVVNDAVRFTIPEGWNVEQIATALAEKGLVDKERFLKEVNEGAFPEFPFVAAIPKKEGRKHRLEGYLFPETYEVKKGATEREIIARMLAQFQKEWKPEWNTELNKRKLTMDEAVTLASIVEREAVVDKERPMVAGVIYNRLREGMLLQVDATVQFVLGKQRERLTFDDLKVESPYNTYLHEGLPPGPIANPGRKSLEAAVYPAAHDFFFYVTKKDGTGEHYFTRTFEEHLAKDAQSRSAGKK